MKGVSMFMWEVIGMIVAVLAVILLLQVVGWELGLFEFIS